MVSFSEMFLSSLGDNNDDTTKNARSNFGRVADSLLEDIANLKSAGKNNDAAIKGLDTKVDGVANALNETVKGFKTYAEGNDKRVGQVEADVRSIRNDWTIGQYTDRAAALVTLGGLGLAIATAIGAGNAKPRLGGGNTTS